MCTNSGTASSIVQMYLAHSLGGGTNGSRVFELKPEKSLQVHSIVLLDEYDKEKDLFECDEVIRIRLSVVLRRSEYGSYGYLALLNAEGNCILESDSNDVCRNAFEGLSIGENVIDVIIPGSYPGSWGLHCYVSFADKQGKSIDSPGMVSASV